MGAHAITEVSELVKDHLCKVFSLPVLTANYAGSKIKRAQMRRRLDELACRLPPLNRPPGSPRHPESTGLTSKLQ
ncbi:unnamed protein product [Protopolystoma xenopodis]|uniref:Uncharacterized protein n=1 Tax=Protopolystoma xenopodis TaxID=117903 RepID=A0A3S5B933_9PLAT|nr:unnamed protein product [Protopolystoma xenopodis]